MVGNYRLIERLGEGGMGTVFRVEHTVLGRNYALKVLRAQVVEKDATAAQRFVREARAAARVRHPNIVDVFDFGYFADGRPYFVMELCEGESLPIWSSAVPLPPDRCRLDRAADRARARGRARPRRDSRRRHAVERLVVDRSPLHVKLVDFGLAAIADEVFDEENTDFVLGTPAYISPEQLHGLPATDRSDQYGLGCVLFEMLTGTPAFQHESRSRAVHDAHPGADSRRREPARPASAEARRRDLDVPAEVAAAALPGHCARSRRAR